MNAARNCDVSFVRVIPSPSPECAVPFSALFHLVKKVSESVKKKLAQKVSKLVSFKFLVSSVSCHTLLMSYRWAGWVDGRRKDGTDERAKKWENVC